MGLDIEFSRRKKGSNTSKEVAYFKKANFIVKYFDYEEDLEKIIVSKYEIMDFVDLCKEVLSIKDLDADGNPTEECAKKCAETLPTTTGFFFGSTEYNENYFSMVENALKQFEVVLKDTDFGTEEFVMCCWW